MKIKLFVLFLALAFPSYVFGQIQQIVFTTQPKIISPNNISSTITIQTQDGLGKQLKTTETIDLEFLSTSSSGEFFNSSTLTPVATYIANGDANRSFRYRDSAEGVFTMTVNAKGRASGDTWSTNQEIFVTSNSYSPIPKFLPYVIDEKPRILFGDSGGEPIDAHLGLENYTHEYIDGYLKISFTYSRYYNNYAGYPPALYVTHRNPIESPQVFIKSFDYPYFFGRYDPTAWYLIEIQFDPTGYAVKVRQDGVSEFHSSYHSISSLQDTDWVALANLYPLQDPIFDQSYSMAFTPVPLTAPLEPPVNKRTPVVIVPGVMGTEIFKGTEKLWMNLVNQNLDPLQFGINLEPVDATLNIGEVLRKPAIFFDYSDKFISELEKQDYRLGKDLFLFPYDWRYGVHSINTDALKQKISEVKLKTGSNKVDIVAHSTGGLLVKKYVMDNPASHHIDKAVFVGVPNSGAPKAIKVLLQGDSFGNPFLSNAQMKKIAENLPVVYDLAPSQSYYDIKGSYVTVVDTNVFNVASRDLNFKETQDFLINDHNLNAGAVETAESLHGASFDNYDLQNDGIDLYSIVGCRAGTIGKVVEQRTLLSNGEVRITHKLKYTPGDETVPLESATNLPMASQNKYFALEATHAKMMSQDGIRQQIVNIISGSSINTGSKITQDISKCKLNGKAISVFSPVNVEITDQYGNYSGIDIQGHIYNEIPNAEVSLMGESKFVYLPTDEGQEYVVSLTGTGEGVFTLEDIDIVDDQVSNVKTFADLPSTTSFKGKLDIDESVLYLDHDGDGQADTILKGVPGETVTMPYLFSGFLPPVKEKNVFKAGSTVPVKFQLSKHDGSIIQAKSAPLWFALKRGAMVSTVASEPAQDLSATVGNVYRWDNSSEQYIYNWSTKGLAPGFWYEIYAKLDDGNIHSLIIGLK
jgi:pimeloyl-ACP methyl ester carboxylesterase